MTTLSNQRQPIDLKDSSGQNDTDLKVSNRAGLSGAVLNTKPGRSIPETR